MNQIAHITTLVHVHLVDLVLGSAIIIMVAILAVATWKGE